MNRPTVEQLISHLQLEPLEGEGGLFRRTWLSSHALEPANLGAPYYEAKPLGSCIYYLLTSEIDSFSAFHRLPTDEIYHFYLGDPVTLFMLDSHGVGEEITLGHDLLHGQHVQYVVKGGKWQASILKEGGQYALMGTTMAPAFTAGDFELGNRAELLAHYPTHHDWITRLTRT